MGGGRERGLAGLVVAWISAASFASALLAGVSVNTATAQANPNITAYNGFGAWVDLYETASFNNPERVIRDLKRYGVNTLYLETGNFSRSSDLYRPEQLARFIRSAHAEKIKVVAWYLPSLNNLGFELRRVKAAIRFRTRDGQHFDSFALDIESDKVRSVSERSRRLLRLSRAIRSFVGPHYSLGAITPPPVAMAKYATTYWPNFPFRQLRRYYDVFLPMNYFTYRKATMGEKPARSYTAGNVTMLRQKTGDPSVPVHIIGGVADRANPATLRGFVKGLFDTVPIGASLYSYGVMKPWHWNALRALH